MRIAYISQPWNTVIPPVNSGSIAIWNYQVSKRMAQSHDILVYSKRSRGQRKRGRYLGVNYRRFRIAPDQWLNRILKRLTRSSDQSPYFSASWHYIWYITRIAIDLRSSLFRPDVVHIHNFSQFVPVVKKMLPGTKVVLHMHSEWLSQLDRTQIADHLKYADLIAGCSQHVIDKVREAFPHYQERCWSVYNGADENVFCKNPHVLNDESDEFKIIFVGRISPEKGVHVLMEAFEQVAERFPQVKLEIIGPDAVTPYEYLVALSEVPLIKDLERFYHRGMRYLDYLKSILPLALAQQVEFVGSIPHNEISSYYQRADLLVNPSFSETFGVSLLEAMACEVPVVATPVGGMREVLLENETGVFVEQGNSASLARAIIHLLQDKHLRLKMGAKGRERVIEKFTWGWVADQLTSHYNNILAI